MWGYANKTRPNTTGVDGNKVPSACQLEIFASETELDAEDIPTAENGTKLPVSEGISFLVSWRGIKILSSCQYLRAVANISVSCVWRCSNSRANISQNLQ
jgi:hypothetical protein